MTVTTTELDLKQPVAVMVCVNVYVVVIVGETVGFETLDENPAGLDDQEYVVPPTVAAPKTFEPPRHIALLVPALAAGNGLTVTILEFVLKQHNL